MKFDKDLMYCFMLVSDVFEFPEKMQKIPFVFPSKFEQSSDPGNVRQILRFFRRIPEMFRKVPGSGGSNQRKLAWERL